MKKNKGFTLVELLISFTLLTVVLIYLIKATTNIMAKENDILMLQEYNVFESTFLNKIYEDIDELSNLKIEENSGELNIKVGDSETIYKNISFINTSDEKGIYYDNVLYELPSNTEFNKEQYYVIKQGTYTEDNYIKNYSIISIPLISNQKNRTINIIFQNVNEDIIIPEKKYICKRAATLHTEKCTQTDGTNYCSGAGYTTTGSKGTTTITYGDLGISGTLKSGDAFDCDVNGDGIYDSKTERFYYVSDLDSKTAVLIYYNNVSGGVPSNNTTYAYDSSNENFHGPVTAIEQLPTISQWSNIKLKNSVRAIKTETGTNSTKGGTLPTNFSYSGKAARLLTIQEVRQGTGISNVPTLKLGELDNFTYLLENTKFASNSNSAWAWWLENAHSNDSTNAWYVDGSSRSMHGNTVSYAGAYGIRPVIEVAKSKIQIEYEPYEILIAKVGDNPENYGTYNDFISDINNIKKIFQSRDAVDYLISYNELFTEIKKLNNYSSDIVPIILSSSVYTNLEKYNNGLPCYLVNKGIVDNNIIGTFGSYNYVDDIHNPNGNTNNSTFTMSCSSGICTNSFSIVEINYPNNWGSKNLLGSKKVNFDKYDMLALDFISFSNTAAYYKEMFGYTQVTNKKFSDSNAAYTNTVSSARIVGVNIKNVTGDYYVGFEHGGNTGTSSSKFYSIFMY